MFWKLRLNWTSWREIVQLKFRGLQVCFLSVCLPTDTHARWTWTQSFVVCREATCLMFIVCECLGKQMCSQYWHTCTRVCLNIRHMCTVQLASHNLGGTNWIQPHVLNVFRNTRCQNDSSYLQSRKLSICTQTKNEYSTFSKASGQEFESSLCFRLFSAGCPFPRTPCHKLVGGNLFNTSLNTSQFITTEGPSPLTRLAP